MKPPKCKSCGAEEWRHTCGPKIDPAIGLGQNKAWASGFGPSGAGSSPAVGCATPTVQFLETTPAGSVLEFDSHLWVALAKPKTDRKEYLKLKARERRARQKAAKASA